VAILLPSLKAARDQAKLVTCQANLKQIGTTIAAYQSEENSYVPVVFNDASSVNAGGSNPPARACWVSVALRKYSPRTARMGQNDVRVIDGVTYHFDPEAVWNAATRNAYETNIMPEHYACPFQRGKGPQRRPTPNDQGFFRVYHKLGRFDSIQTWLWENVIRGQLPPHGEPWPLDSRHDGVPRYTAFSWNCVRPYPGAEGRFPDGTTVPSIANGLAAGSGPTDPSKRTYRKWSLGDVRRLRSGSLSTSSVAYCAQGENILGAQPNRRIGWANPGSHASLGKGGTNAIFADTHVEWVPGRQIGWP